VAEPTAPTEPTCSTGIPGIESSDGMVCCPVGCTMCGGSGCSTVGMPDYGAESCCSSDVLSTGASCSETEEAPCVLVDVPAPTPSPVSLSFSFDFDDDVAPAPTPVAEPTAPVAE
ncbi:unnamed protein product, partial [Ectocarpus sp. 12 AP-2014]